MFGQTAHLQRRGSAKHGANAAPSDNTVEGLAHDRGYQQRAVAAAVFWAVLAFPRMVDNATLHQQSLIKAKAELEEKLVEGPGQGTTGILEDLRRD